ncbi:MAG: hypothetical protein R2838_22970 [Caldilineaceae bacterium]
MAQVREFQDSADDVLLRRIAEQDVAAHEEFYRRYAAQAYGVIVRIVRERAVADELLQEVFWQVWRSARSIEAATGGLAHADCGQPELDQLRRLLQARPKLQDAPDRSWKSLVGPRETTPDALFESAARRAHVKSALAQIPPEQRVHRVGLLQRADAPDCHADRCGSGHHQEQIALGPGEVGAFAARPGVSLIQVGGKETRVLAYRSTPMTRETLVSQSPVKLRRTVQVNRQRFAAIHKPGFSEKPGL